MSQNIIPANLPKEMQSHHYPILYKAFSCELNVNSSINDGRPRSAAPTSELSD